MAELGENAVVRGASMGRLACGKGAGRLRQDGLHSHDMALGLLPARPPSSSRLSGVEGEAGHHVRSGSLRGVAGEHLDRSLHRGAWVGGLILMGAGFEQGSVFHVQGDLLDRNCGPNVRICR